MNRPVRALVFLLIAWPALLRADVYVSPGGNDAGDGTADRPVRTLRQAQELARDQNRGRATDLTIWLSGGTYRLTAPLVFDGRDGGDQRHRVIWAAAPGESPVISGGVRVTGWRQVDAGRDLWSAPAPARVVYARQLYIDGVRADRARGRLPVTLERTAFGYRADSGRLASWRNPSDLEFVYTGGDPLWSEQPAGFGAAAEPRIPVAAIHGRMILMAPAAWGAALRLVPRGAMLPEYVENAYELLGTPGQWYFDRKARSFYYVPRPGEDLATADVEVPVLETLVAGAGTPDRPLTGLVFQGLQFSYAAWFAPSFAAGFPDARIPGNVRLSDAQRVEFDRDAFVHLGGAGLELDGEARDDSVAGCVFGDISGDGLELDPGGDLAGGGLRLKVGRGNRIADNWFFDVAAEYHAGAAIRIGRAEGIRVEHNRIDQMPASGISIGPGPARRSLPILVEDNAVFDDLRLLADGGAIRIRGSVASDLANGVKVVGNLIEDQFGTGCALASEAGPATIAGNVIFRIGGDDWRVAAPGVVRGNYWQQGGPERKMPGLSIARNRLITAPDQAPRTIRADAGIEPGYRDILDERFGAPACPGQPERVASWVGPRFALVAWNPPRTTGGAPIRSYTVIASGGGPRMTISAGQFQSEGYVRIDGLMPNRSYAFTVVAANANGVGPASLPSDRVKPSIRKISRPGAPARVSVQALGGMACVRLQGPLEGSDGGSPILAYEMKIQPSDRRIVFSGRKILTLGLTAKAGTGRSVFEVIDGLAVGQAYTFRVAAVNAAGPGPSASPVTATVAP